jgi:hypothetical protein
MPSPRTGGSVVRKDITKYTTGGSVCKIVHKESSKDNNPKLGSNDIESGYTIGFADGLEKGRNEIDGPSFNDGFISCYMKYVLLPEISKSFTIPILLSSELSSDGKNININIKDNSCSHILSITVIRGDSMTFIVKEYKYTPNSGKGNILHETTDLDMNSLFSFLTKQIRDHI